MIIIGHVVAVALIAFFVWSIYLTSKLTPQQEKELAEWYLSRYNKDK